MMVQGHGRWYRLLLRVSVPSHPTTSSLTRPLSGKAMPMPMAKNALASTATWSHQTPLSQAVQAKRHMHAQAQPGGGEVIPYNLRLKEVLQGPKHEAYARALEVLEQMNANHINPSPITISTVLQILSRCRHPQFVEEAFKTYKIYKEMDMEPNDFVYSSILGICAKAPPREVLDHAWGVWMDICERNYVPNVVVFNALMHACAKAAHPDALRRAFEVKDEMTSNNVEPTIVTLTTLINACARNSRQNDDAVYKAFQVFEEVVNRRLMPSHSTFTSLLMVCSTEVNSDRMTLSFRLMEDMANFGLRPNMPIYTALLRVCLNNLEDGDLGPKKAMEIFEIIQDDPDLSPTIATFTTLIEGLCRRNGTENIERALYVYEAMGEVEPDVRIHVALLEVLLRDSVDNQKSFDRAIAMYDHFWEHQQIPPQKLITEFLRACLNYERLDKALEVYLDLTEMRIRVPTILASKLVHQCGKSGDEELLAKGLKILNTLKKGKNCPEPEHFISLLEACVVASNLDIVRRASSFVEEGRTICGEKWDGFKEDEERIRSKIPATHDNKEGSK